MKGMKRTQAPKLSTLFGVHQTMQCDREVDILGNTSPADEVEAEATIRACIISGLLELVGRGLSRLHLLKRQYTWSRSRRCPWRSPIVLGGPEAGSVPRWFRANVQSGLVLCC